MALTVSSMSGFGSGGGGASFIIQSVDYNGSSAYSHRNGGWTSATDTSSGIFSVWVRIDAGDGTGRYLFASDSRHFSLQLNGSNKWSFKISAVNGETKLQGTHSPLWTASSTWLHIYMSWDVNKAEDNKDFVFKINGTENTPYNLSDNADAITVNHTTADFDLMGQSASNDPWNGCVAEWFLDIDAAYSTDETKFRGADGKPVDLGLDGSGPSGSQPLAYFSVREDEDEDDFLVNKGFGGNIVMEDGGPLVIGSDSPSD